MKSTATTNQRRHRFFRNASGFTLLEVMVVVTIIAAVITLVVPRIGSRNREIKASVRRFSVISKQLHLRAKATNATYRLAIDLKNGQNTREEPQTFWVEVSDKPGPFETPEQLIAERKELEENPEEDEEGKIIPKVPGGFKLDPSIFKEQKEIAQGVFIRDVEIGSSEKAFTEGIVYIHYSPQGLAEDAAIHFQMGEKSFWTVSIHPLTGRATIVGQDISLKEIQDQ